MPKGIHSNPDCQCCFCKAKRREYSGENSHKGMLGKGYLISGKKSGGYGKHNKHHKPDCQCYFCKRKRGEVSGEKHWQWKGKEYQGSRGWWYIWIDGIKYLRARYVAEQYLGRELLKEEIIHHINEDKSDDRPENLYLFPNQSKHCGHHFIKSPPTLTSNITA